MPTKRRGNRRRSAMVSLSPRESRNRSPSLPLCRGNSGHHHPFHERRILRSRTRRHLLPTISIRPTSLTGRASLFWHSERAFTPTTCLTRSSSTLRSHVSSNGIGSTVRQDSSASGTGSSTTWELIRSRGDRRHGSAVRLKGQPNDREKSDVIGGRNAGWGTRRKARPPR